MKSIIELIRTRRSVRTFDERPIPSDVLAQLTAYMQQIENPYGIPVRFELLNAKEHGLSSPVISGGDYYIAAAVEDIPHSGEAFGFSFEALVLYAWSLGLGTTWIGGTMNRGLFERAMKLADNETMIAVTPIGYPAEKMSLRETMMRKGVKASVRAAFGEAFFDGSFDVPLTEEKAGKLFLPLEMVRLGPSAVNKQPWRVLVTENAVHFYVKKGMMNAAVGSMQKADLGIALCHFALTAKELGIDTEFVIDDPKCSKADVEYIASYLIK